MEILITEKQLRKIVLSEQRPDNLMPFQPDNPAYTGKAGGASEITPDDLQRGAQNAKKDRQENGELHMLINSLMIPGGVFADALIGLFMGAMEYSKGNKKTAAAVGLLSLLPYYSKIKAAIPDITKLGKDGINTLATKIGGVNKIPLTPVENEVVKGLALHKQELQQLVSRVDDALSTTTKYKDQYVRTHGVAKFQELFKKLVNGQFNKQQYVNELLTGLKDTYKSVKLGTVAGIKFLPQEEQAIVNASKLIQNGKVGDVFKLKLNINGVESEVKLILHEYPPSAFDMAAKNTKDIILVNMNNIRNFTYEKIVNTLSHEAAHIKDISISKSTKMMNEYQNILDKIVKAENMFNDAMAKFGEGSDQVFQARKMYSKYFTKYKYHYMEMVANNAKVMQSLSRKLPDVISQYGVPETQKMLQSMRYGLRKGIPDNINFYMDKFIGAENAKYMKEIRVFDKNLYKDLMKKLSKQLDYMEEQLKLYQQY